MKENQSTSKDVDETRISAVVVEVYDWIDSNRDRLQIQKIAEILGSLTRYAESKRAMLMSELNLRALSFYPEFAGRFRAEILAKYLDDPRGARANTPGNRRLTQREEDSAMKRWFSRNTVTVVR